MEWIAKWVAGGIFKVFGDTIIQPLLTAFLKAKDVDLEKYKSAETNTVQMASAVLAASLEFAKVKSAYVTTVLSWWPFRVILFALLFFPTMHFVLIVIDSSCPQAWGLHIVNGHNFGGCGLLIPDIDPSVKDIYKEMLLFFIIAKPADTAISGALNLVSQYLRK